MKRTKKESYENKACIQIVRINKQPIAINVIANESGSENFPNSMFQFFLEEVEKMKRTLVSKTNDGALLEENTDLPVFISKFSKIDFSFSVLDLD